MGGSRLACPTGSLAFKVAAETPTLVVADSSKAIQRWDHTPFGPQISNLRSDLTSEAVWRPYWPLTSSESLKNSPTILINHQKIKSSNSLMSAAGLLGPNLVTFYRGAGL